MSEISEIIKSLRSSGLTQAQIAKKTGIPQPRLSKWGADKAPVGADDALKLLALDKKISKRKLATAPANTAQAAINTVAG